MTFKFFKEFVIRNYGSVVKFKFTKESRDPKNPKQMLAVGIDINGKKIVVLGPPVNNVKKT